MNLITQFFSNLWRSFILTATFAVLTFTVLTQANPGTELPNRDYGFYAYIGKQIAKGQLPYRDVWESKPPAIFYLNAFALRLGRGSRWGIWLVEFIFLFAAIATSYHLLKKLWGVTPALLGVIIWLWGLDATLVGGNYTEEYPLLFHFLSLSIFLNLMEDPKNYLNNLALGILLAGSFLFRPNNAIVEAGAILALAVSLIQQRKTRDLVFVTTWVTAGFIAPIVITSAYFAYHGLFRAMLEASILYNFAYSSFQLSSSSPLQAGFEFLNVSAWVALLGYILLPFQAGKYRGTPLFSLLILLLVGTPAAIYLSDPAKRNYIHYFMNWLPFIALLSGFAFYTLQKMLAGITKNIHTPAILPLMIALTLSTGFFIGSGRISQYKTTLEHMASGQETEARSPISIYVENHTHPGEYVLFWAALPGENLMSKRDAPYSTLFYPLMVKSEISDRLNADFFEDIKRNPPVLIVDTESLDRHSLDPQKRASDLLTGISWPFPPDNLEEVYAFIEKNYYLDAVIKGKSVYRLNGTTKP